MEAPKQDAIKSVMRISLELTYVDSTTMRASVEPSKGSIRITTAGIDKILRDVLPYVETRLVTKALEEHLKRQQMEIDFARPNPAQESQEGSGY